MEEDEETEEAEDGEVDLSEEAADPRRESCRTREDWLEDLDSFLLLVYEYRLWLLLFPLVSYCPQRLSPPN